MELKKETVNEIMDMMIQKMTENKIDYVKINLQLGEFEMKKTIHFAASQIKNEEKPPEPTEEELLYMSSIPNLRINL